MLQSRAGSSRAAHLDASTTHTHSYQYLTQSYPSGVHLAGISLKTQELYVIVFVSRYLDLFWNFLSIYNWVGGTPPTPVSPRARVK